MVATTLLRRSARFAPGGPASVGVAGSVVEAEKEFSLEREVVTNRALRSGAVLAREGPPCVPSFYLYAVLIGGGGDGSADLW